MAAAAGIFNPQTLAGQGLTGGALKPMDSTTGTNSSSDSNSASGSSATISANDFLTLLVTEMQNQDPTATTDPNEYINQLVQVNSLEQLIGINQTLTGALGTPSSNSTNSATGQTASADSLLTDPGSSSGSADATKPAQATAPAAALAGHAAVHAPRFAAVAGNLGVPAANPAAARLASALDGHTLASPMAAGMAGVR